MLIDIQVDCFSSHLTSSLLFTRIKDTVGPSGSFIGLATPCHNDKTRFHDIVDHNIFADIFHGPEH